MSEEKKGFGNLFQPDDDSKYQQFLNEMRDPEVRKVKEQLGEVDERFQTWFGQAREGDPEALRTPRHRQAYYTARATELLSQHWTPDFEVLFWVLEQFYCDENKNLAEKQEVIILKILERFGGEKYYGMKKSRARYIDSIARSKENRTGGRSKNR